MTTWRVRSSCSRQPASALDNAAALPARCHGVHRLCSVALALALALVVVTGCTATPTSHPAPVVPVARQTVLDSDGQLGGALLGALGPPSQNAVLSPYSIAVALQMALEGARGATAEQIAATLHLPGVGGDALAAQAAALRRDLSAVDDPVGGVRLRVSNELWPQARYSIKAPFVQLLRTSFGVDVRPVDFANDPPGARRTINHAISEQTNGKIPELFHADLDPQTRLVLTNAVYLKAGWATTFADTLTRPSTFHAAGQDVQVPFMHTVGEFGYVERSGYRLVSLPYRNNRLAMTLVLPDGPLAPLEQRLRQDGLGALLGGKLPLTGVTLRMPKFRFRTNVQLNDALRRLGMTDAFDPGRADFSGISDEQLFVSQVVHDAYVSVDEKGTEAAAATGVVAQATSGVAGRMADVTVDHPFLFAITDQATGTPLFLGRVADPAQE
jgi:serpin B